TAATAVPAAAQAGGSDGGGGGGGGSPYVLPPPAPPGATPTQPTAPPSSNPSAGTTGSESSAPLRVNGNAIFPRMVWRQCPTYYPTSLGAGINLFLGVECTGTDEQFKRLAGRAMSTVDAKTPGISGPGLIGWHLPDEADMSVRIPANLP